MKAIDKFYLISYFLIGLCIIILYTMDKRDSKEPPQKNVISSSISESSDMSDSLFSFEEKVFEVTAYCPCSKCCGKFADGITASGHVIKYGDRLIAAPKEYAFGTIMDVPNYELAHVLDRGGAINSNKIDVLIYEKSPYKSLTDLEWSHMKALEWGRQTLTIKIYREK